MSPLLLGLTVGAFILPLVLLLVILRKVARKNANLVGHDQLNPGEFDCPQCHRRMENGFAFSGRGIIYHPRAGKPLSPFAHIGQALENTVSLHLRPAENQAWHCGNCRLVLIDHSRLVRSRRGA
jgi:hypothetical protein